MKKFFILALFVLGMYNVSAFGITQEAKIKQQDLRIKALEAK